MAGEITNSHEELRAQLLASIGEKCALNCSFAQAKADQAAAASLNGGEFETLQANYADAAGGCEGPEEIQVCGAEEGKKTYSCRVLGKLMTMSLG